MWNPAACHGNWFVIFELVYKIPYRRERAWPSGRVRRASKGILHTIFELVSRLANDIGLLSYSKLLKKVNLISLEKRQVLGDLIETSKVVTGKVEYGKDILSSVDLNMISLAKLIMALPEKYKQNKKLFSA